MKKLVFSVLAAAVAAGLAYPTTATAKKYKKKKHHYYSSRHLERQPIYDSNRMQFGSREWWDQMVREDRARR